jgi:DNA-binding transcriptional LysR family regulator
MMSVISRVDEELLMNLATLDLNLLVPLDHLLRERSVTRAAARLGLGQPALSASLARLRRHFGDELLTRVGNSYELTPLAVQLRERTAAALAGVERVFASQPVFDPASSQRTFSVLVSDYPMAVIGEHVGKILDETAPRVRLRFDRYTTPMIDAAEETLRMVDGLVMPHGFVSDVPHLDLWTDEWRVLVARSNTVVGSSLTMEHLATLPWVLTYHAPSAFTPASRQLQMLGVEPRVQLVAESFLALPWLIAGTDRIALVQAELAPRLTFGGEVRVLPCPFDAMRLTEALWWHPVHDRDPEHTWLRSVFAEAGRRIGARRTTDPKQ